MARWKAWLCRFGMPGRARVAWRSSPASARAPVSTAAIAPCPRVEPHVRVPAVGQQRLLREDRRHVIAGLLDCERLRAPSICIYMITTKRNGRR